MAFVFTQSGQVCSTTNPVTVCVVCCESARLIIEEVNPRPSSRAGASSKKWEMLARITCKNSCFYTAIHMSSIFEGATTRQLRGWLVAPDPDLGITPLDGPGLAIRGGFCVDPSHKSHALPPLSLPLTLTLTHSLRPSVPPSPSISLSPSLRIPLSFSVGSELPAHYRATKISAVVWEQRRRIKLN